MELEKRVMVCGKFCLEISGVGRLEFTLVDQNCQTICSSSSVKTVIDLESDFCSWKQVPSQRKPRKKFKQCYAVPVQLSRSLCVAVDNHV